MYTVANPDPNPRGWGQLPNLKSAILRKRVQRGETRWPLTLTSAILR